jgi:urea transporter/murein DD-endopeptidase MepM/ murein hydrolase activator NlpD
LSLRRACRELLTGYAAVMFARHPGVGLLFLAATLLVPEAGALGLAAALAGLAGARLLGLPEHAAPAYACNSLLVGLSLGAVHAPEPRILTLVLLGAVAAAWLTAVAQDWLWRLDRLPALSAPFVVVAFATAYVAGGAHLPVPANSGLARLLGEPWDGFLTALGSTFFTPYPLAGALVLAGLLAASRYAAFLALAGYAVGHAVFVHWSGEAAVFAARWGGFNFVLTAIALGGFFVVPGRAALALAMAGVVLAALLVAAGHRLFLEHGLPVLALPFLAATFLVLASLRRRARGRGIEAVTEHPDLPEVLSERARLFRARSVGLASVPLAAPFYGEWRVSQGFDGPHTHKAAWRHALDFEITAEGRNCTGSGAALTDYYCFGAPVLAPAAGWVAACRDNVPDNPPGEVNTRENWGNYVLIRRETGQHVLLAHLKQGSVLGRMGDWVAPGQALGACGNSGRSPLPHLHLQVQEGEALGSPTVPFHLACVNEDRGEGRQFRLAVQPDEGAFIQAPGYEGRLARALRLPSGMELTYRWRAGEGPWSLYRLKAHLSLLGQYTLTGANGATAAFVQSPVLLAFYDRAGGADRFLDLWLLALGLTPLSESVSRWRDAPPARLLPAGLGCRLARALRHPLGSSLRSDYRRVWDEAGQVWRQTGEHRLAEAVVLRTEAALSARGCVWFAGRADGFDWRAELVSAGSGPEEAA